ncbi:MAG TPA: hypothetical protein VM925_23875 [Labilithrix sp.]|nr:hypothetical protein [Labilithrix sp.]
MAVVGARDFRARRDLALRPVARVRYRDGVEFEPPETVCALAETEA